jgi:hypothetical protein
VEEKMTVHEILETAGRCPECGADLNVVNIPANKEGLVMEGRCLDDGCDTSWIFELSITET